jgi:hypothetical protein
MRFKVLRRDPDAPEWLLAGAVYAGVLDRDPAAPRVWLYHPDEENAAKYLAGLDDLQPIPDA